MALAISSKSTSFFAILVVTNALHNVLEEIHILVLPVKARLTESSLRIQVEVEFLALVARTFVEELVKAAKW